jgi:hypothetical protein
LTDVDDRRRAENELAKALDEIGRLKDRLHEENTYLQDEIRRERRITNGSGQRERKAESQSAGRVWYSVAIRCSPWRKDGFSWRQIAIRLGASSAAVRRVYAAENARF